MSWVDVVFAVELMLTSPIFSVLELDWPDMSLIRLPPVTLISWIDMVLVVELMLTLPIFSVLELDWPDMSLVRLPPVMPVYWVDVIFAVELALTWAVSSGPLVVTEEDKPQYSAMSVLPTPLD